MIQTKNRYTISLLVLIITGSLPMKASDNSHSWLTPKGVLGMGLAAAALGGLAYRYIPSRAPNRAYSEHNATPKSNHRQNHNPQPNLWSRWFSRKTTLQVNTPQVSEILPEMPNELTVKRLNTGGVRMHTDNNNEYTIPVTIETSLPLFVDTNLETPLLYTTYEGKSFYLSSVDQTQLACSNLFTPTLKNMIKKDNPNLPERQIEALAKKFYLAHNPQKTGYYPIAFEK